MGFKLNKDKLTQLPPKSSPLLQMRIRNTCNENNSRTVCILVAIGIYLLSFNLCVDAHGSHQHSGSHHPTDTNRMHNNKMAQDFEHIAEHLKEKINVKKEMSPEEMEFYYFMEHDFNNDSRLDGLEILSAIKHSELATDLRVDTQNLTTQQKRDAHHMEITYYTDIIDEIMKEDDFNNDGYLSYLEYVLARRRDDELEERNKKQQSKQKQRDP